MSPRDEFHKLSMIYVKAYGKAGPVWGNGAVSLAARLGRIKFSCTGESLSVFYLAPCAANYALVYTSENGFQREDWYQHLETIRNHMLLERLAIIPND